MELKKLENSSVALTLTLKSERIEEEYGKSLKDYAKKLTIKGFRTGRAPVSLIERMYGDAIREELTFKLMEENLQESYKDMDAKDRPLPYSTPELQDEDSLFPFKAGQDITYTVKYDVIPEIKLAQYKGLELEYEETKVSDEEVNEEIERLRQQNAMIVAKSGAVAEGDIVTMDYVELDADKSITITTNDDMKLKNIIDILQSKLVKRNLSIKILDPQNVENALGGNVRQVFNLKKGLTQELAKKIVADIKSSKLKVQAAIQGEQVRVSGKSKDDLQDVIKLLREKEDSYNIPLQFTNYR